ncbi:hypothetical protein EGR_10999 [Echinococcus granulosus]|uniref:Uncharacterized protein n=1 Tax=Echinococcus granulosus TaxID=6210 RepID=W6UKX1_ECHGR|nr:hypothetical protein EGR_10999 [Echinococcus granulosus]EUB54144.1 hypothetical protein EGR_10999 [Echinococcus granulosus]
MLRLLHRSISDTNTSARRRQHCSRLRSPTGGCEPSLQCASSLSREQSLVNEAKHETLAAPVTHFSLESVTTLWQCVPAALNRPIRHESICCDYCTAVFLTPTRQHGDDNTAHDFALLQAGVSRAFSVRHRFQGSSR